MTHPQPVGVRSREPRPGGGSGLFVHLGASFLFCAFLGVSGILEAETFKVWFWWMAAWSLYWLVLVVLQVRWWGQGYDHFWRPVYSWVLTVFGVVLLGLPGLVLVAMLYPGESFSHGVVDLIGWLGSPALLLLIPRFRVWLFRQWKPFDPPPVGTSLVSPSS